MRCARSRDEFAAGPNALDALRDARFLPAIAATDLRMLRARRLQCDSRTASSYAVLRGSVGNFLASYGKVYGNFSALTPSARHLRIRTFRDARPFIGTRQVAPASFGGMDNMLAQRGSGRFLSRSGPAIAVIGMHVLIVYGLAVSMGIVKLPKFAAPIEAIFIPEQTESQPEPEIKVKPEIEDVVPLDEPLPEVQYDEPVAPPAEIPIAAVRERDRATAATGAPAQELKTTTASSRSIRRLRVVRVRKARSACACWSTRTAARAR